MARQPYKCVRCGGIVPPRASTCVHCGYEGVDRSVWYNRYAPEIAGGLMGAFLAMVLMVFLVPGVMRIHSVRVLNLLYDLYWLWALIGGAIGVATARVFSTGPLLSD